MPGTLLPDHGGYQDLLSYQKAEIVYDATVVFCRRFLDRRDRTVGQMTQAARSGKQNIAEGSMASGTSKEMELKLTNVARASQQELLEDYRDFLRTHGLRLWDKNSEEALYVRRLSRGEIAPAESRNGTNATNGTNGTHDADGDHMSHGSHSSHRVTFEAFRSFCETRSSEVVANIVICLIHQTNYLLDQQIRQIEHAFLEEGGLRERMTAARLARRAEQRRGGS